MSTPLYQLKAEFFKTLGHPARIRVLELLSDREHAVAEMLPEVGIEPAHLSQQLAVLRRAGLVTSRKEGSAVYYSLTSPHVAELLAVARLILTGVLSGRPSCSRTCAPLPPADQAQQGWPRKPAGTRPPAAGRVPPLPGSEMERTTAMYLSAAAYPREAPQSRCATLANWPPPRSRSIPSAPG